MPGARASRPHDGCGRRVRGRPARMTDEARDPGGQLFCRLSASLSRRRDPVDRRCIARNDAVARFMALLFRREKKEKRKNTLYCQQTARISQDLRY